MNIFLEETLCYTVCQLLHYVSRDCHWLIDLILILVQICPSTGSCQGQHRNLQIFQISNVICRLDLGAHRDGEVLGCCARFGLSQNFLHDHQTVLLDRRVLDPARAWSPTGSSTCRGATCTPVSWCPCRRTWACPCRPRSRRSPPGCTPRIRRTAASSRLLNGRRRRTLTKMNFKNKF